MVNVRSTILVASLFLLQSGIASGATIAVELTDKDSRETTFHSLNTESGKVSVASASGGNVLEPTQAFSIRGRQLLFSSNPVAEADEVLAQGQEGGVLIAIARHEYNSFSNPLRILAALAGHPTRVSQILVVAVKDGRVVSGGCPVSC